MCILLLYLQHFLSRQRQNGVILRTDEEGVEKSVFWLKFDPSWKPHAQSWRNIAICALNRNNRVVVFRYISVDKVERQGWTAARYRRPNWKRAVFRLSDGWRRQRRPWLILHFLWSSAPSVFPTVSKSLCLSAAPAFYRSAFPDCRLIGAFLPSG